MGRGFASSRGACYGGPQVTEPKAPGGPELEAIDDGWGVDPEPKPKASPTEPAPAPPAAKVEPRTHSPVAPQSRPLARRGEKAAPRPVPRPVQRPLGPAPEPPTPPPDDEIEFEADVVTRDSMPTFQHPNPLVFDRDPDADGAPVPRPPRLPKIKRRP